MNMMRWSRLVEEDWCMKSEHEDEKYTYEVLMSLHPVYTTL